MANPFDQFDGGNPFDRFDGPKKKGPTKEEKRAQLAQGATLKVGPIDTGVELPQGVTEFLAGMGRRFADIGTLGNRGTRDEAADAALDASGYATAGGVTADLTTLLGGGAALRGGGGLLSKAPTVLADVGRGAQVVGRAVMAPQTIPQAAAVGAAYGGATTDGDAVDRAIGAVAGGAGGALGQALPRVAEAAGRTVKSLAEPFYEEGQQQIAARVLQRFAEDPAKAAAAAANPQVLVPGTRPTLAEATGDIGLASLQRTLANNPDVGTPLARQLATNAGARISALQGIAGDDIAMAAAQSAREAAVNRLYQMAFDTPPKMTAASAKAAQSLMQRPAFQAARQRAMELAANEGIDITANPVRGLHYAKMALDDQISSAVRSGDNNLARILRGVQDDVVKLLDDVSPAYKEARQTFQQMSGPINRMEVGRELAKKLQPAVNEGAAVPRTTAATFANAMRDADALAQRATGFSGARMADILSPDEMTLVSNILADLQRSAGAAEAGKALGSNTAQNLVSQNILRQMLGPTGLPESWAENTLLLSLMRPAQFVGRLGEQNVLNRLGQAVLDPQDAARLLQMTQQPNRLAQIGMRAGPVFALPGAAMSVEAAQ